MNYQQDFLNIFPWLKSSYDRLPGDKEYEEFYKDTYSYNNESWELRVEENADDDESTRYLFVYFLCKCKPLSNKSTISSIWKDINQSVVCPLAMTGELGSKLKESYINFGVQNLSIQREIVNKIYNNVFIDITVTDEMIWADRCFVNWYFADLEKCTANTANIMVENTSATKETIMTKTTKPLSKNTLSPINMVKMKLKVVNDKILNTKIELLELAKSINIKVKASLAKQDIYKMIVDAIDAQVDDEYYSESESSDDGFD